MSPIIISCEQFHKAARGQQEQPSEKMGFSHWNHLYICGQIELSLSLCASFTPEWSHLELNLSCQFIACLSLFVLDQNWLYLPLSHLPAFRWRADGYALPSAWVNEETVSLARQRINNHQYTAPMGVRCGLLGKHKYKGTNCGKLAHYKLPNTTMHYLSLSLNSIAVFLAKSIPDKIVPLQLYALLLSLLPCNTWKPIRLRRNLSISI